MAKQKEPLLPTLQSNPMTVAELAKKLNAPVSEVFNHYRKIMEEIPQDENYVLSTAQIKRALPNYKPEEQITEAKETTPMKPKLRLTKLEDLKAQLEDRRTKRTEVLNQYEPYFKKSEKAILKEFKQHNSTDSLLFEGDFRKVPNKNFGYFKRITFNDGKEVTYPISNDIVDDIFIATSELKDGRRYSFEATLAKKFEREKHANPFLLQAKNDFIQEIEELSEVKKELNLKKSKLDEMETFLQNVESEFETKKKQVEERVSQAFQEKQAEANTIIEEYQVTINKKFNEVQEKEKQLSTLTETVEATNNHLQKMENLIAILKDRVSICRNLEFISKEDENKYLNLLSDKDFKPVNHFDFEADFEMNFAKLSDHIHAYLFHKKNLIYTRYQIRNFLTLLKTHDIIVLSGLSGSGKTQIVKAFAEALGGVAKIIPVKPNWTSSDDLIGYYNPLQMTFLPTPFTEAIVEAIHNPNQLYFICLDEMNLARAEYYFADFLSKLEERSTQPEIELYANHEEELFVSEFNTLLNLIESSAKGKKIKSWQEFLDNEEARKSFFEMLGNTDKESMLQLHVKMKRRLIDILKFPSTIKIPENVRFIGAINVDETTHYFSPKILDRIHVVKFENPLLFEELVSNRFDNTELDMEMKPVHIYPKQLSERKEFPSVNSNELVTIASKLKEINQKFLLPLNIDFGIRSIRQSLNYAELNKSTYEYGDNFDISLNTVILQKIFPRFIFDGSEFAKNGKSKLDVVKEFNEYLSNEFSEFYYGYEADESEIGKASNEYLSTMIEQAEKNSNSQFNFFA